MKTNGNLSIVLREFWRAPTEDTNRIIKYILEDEYVRWTILENCSTEEKSKPDVTLTYSESGTDHNTLLIYITSMHPSSTNIIYSKNMHEGNFSVISDIKDLNKRLCRLQNYA